MKIKWRKWNRAIHRDLGYFFFALTVIYSLSGIAVNHINDWNPNYIITNENISVHIPAYADQIDKNVVLDILNQIDEKENYKKHYFPGNTQLKIFIDGGNAVIDLETGNGTVEKIKRRPIFHAVNYLHYNPGNWWKWFSDIYAGALILLAITGLFILKGKNGIKGRGAWLTILGLIIPLFILYFLL